MSIILSKYSIFDLPHYTIFCLRWRTENVRLVSDQDITYTVSQEQYALLHFTALPFTITANNLPSTVISYV